MSDSDLLFGLLAFQNELVNRQQLIQALKTWQKDSKVALEHILVEQNALDEKDCPIVARLVELLVERHGDAANSLTTLTESGGILESLQSVLESEPTIKATSAWLEQFSEQAPSQRPSPSRGLLSERFSMLDKYAEGGLGVVFTAEDRQLNRKVAVKQIKPLHADMPAFRSKFNYEALVTGKLEHPSVVPVYASGEDHAGRPYYAMKFIQGESLKDSIQEFHRALAGSNRPFNGPELRRLLRRFVSVCEAISYAHSRGILHRDIKPSNVMLGKFGETLVVDWGLAKSVQPTNLDSDETDVDLATQHSVISQLDSHSDSETAYGSMCGTPEYAPPEQILGRLDEMCPASDVFSLGAVLVEILTGKTHLKRSPSSDQMIKQLSERKLHDRFSRQVPRPLVAISCKATALEIPNRYPTVASFKADLQRWLDDEETEALPDSLFRAAARWGRAHRTTTTSIGVGGIVAAILASVLWTQAARSAFDLQKAKSKAEQALVQAQNATLDALLKQVDVLEVQGQYSQAAQSLDRIGNEHELDSSQQLRLARFYQQASQPLEVESILEAIGETQLVEKEQALFKLIKGDLLLGGTDDDLGLQLLQEAIASELLPPAEEAYARAVIAEDSQSCIAAFDECLKLDRLHSMALVKRGMSYLVLGKIRLAESDAILGRALFPEDDRFLVLQASLLAVTTGRQAAYAVLDEADEESIREDMAAVDLISSVYSPVQQGKTFTNVGQAVARVLTSAATSGIVRSKKYACVGLANPQLTWIGKLYSSTFPNFFDTVQLLAGRVPDRIRDELHRQLPDHQLVNFFVGASEFEKGDFLKSHREFEQAASNDPLVAGLSSSSAWMNLCSLEATITRNLAKRNELLVEIPQAGTLVSKFAIETSSWDIGFAEDISGESAAWYSLAVNGFAGQAAEMADYQLKQGSLESEDYAIWETRKQVSVELAQRIPELFKEIQRSKKSND